MTDTNILTDLTTDRAVFSDLVRHWQSIPQDNLPPTTQKLLQSYITLLRDGLSLTTALVYDMEKRG